MFFAVRNEYSVEQLRIPKKYLILQIIYNSNNKKINEIRIFLVRAILIKVLVLNINENI